MPVLAQYRHLVRVWASSTQAKTWKDKLYIWIEKVLAINQNKMIAIWNRKGIKLFGQSACLLGLTIDVLHYNMSRSGRYFETVGCKVELKHISKLPELKIKSSTNVFSVNFHDMSSVHVLKVRVTVRKVWLIIFSLISFTGKPQLAMYLHCVECHETMVLKGDSTFSWLLILMTRLHTWIRRRGQWTESNEWKLDGDSQGYCVTQSNQRFWMTDTL